MSQVLYRKHRPDKFEEITGQEFIVQTLMGALRKELISHAYLFAGPRGTGKTTIARLMAKAVNCLERNKNKDKESGDKIVLCGKCVNCSTVQQGRSVDIIEIDAASNRGINEIRDLKEGIRIRPAVLPYKVYIIDEVHMLTNEAFNALLKTLEEPPSHAIFILATTELNKIPATILSRVQLFNFRLLTNKEIFNRLRLVSNKEKREIDDQALEIIAELANGSIRDAESVLSQIFSFAGEKISAEDVRKTLAMPAEEEAMEILEKFLAKDKSALLKIIRTSFNNGADPKELINILIKYLRDMVLIKADLSLMEMIAVNFSDKAVEKLKSIASVANEADIAKLLKILIEELSRLRKYPMPAWALELAVINFFDIDKDNNAMFISAKQSNKKRIEQKEVRIQNKETLPKEKTEQSEKNAAKIEIKTEDKKIKDTPEILLEEIKRLWPRVAESFKPINHTLAVILKCAELRNIVNNRLTIGTKYDFYKQQINSVKYRAEIEKIIAEILGRAVSIEAIVSDFQPEVELLRENNDDSGENLEEMAKDIFGI